MSTENRPYSDDTLVTCFFDVPPAHGGRIVEDGASICRQGARADAPSPPPSLAVSASLRSGGKRIVLLCGERFIVGRHRGCEIVPPEVEAEDKEARRLRLRVSRMHCELSRERTAWVVRDGVRQTNGERQHSSFGTWWKGEPVTNAAFLDAEGSLTLGGLSPADSVAIDVRPVGDSLAMSFRQDPQCEYVLLDGEFDLGVLNDALRGCCVFFSSGDIRWRHGKQSGAFVPGTQFAGADAGFWVE